MGKIGICETCKKYLDSEIPRKGCIFSYWVEFGKAIGVYEEELKGSVQKYGIGIGPELEENIGEAERIKCLERILSEHGRKEDIMNARKKFFEYIQNRVIKKLDSEGVITIENTPFDPWDSHSVVECKNYVEAEG